jgi:hypothetical protein
MEDAIKKMKAPEQGAKPEEVKVQMAELQKQQAALGDMQKQLEEQKTSAMAEVEAARMKLAFDQKNFEQEKRMAEQQMAMDAKFTMREIALAQKEADMENELNATLREAKLEARAAMRAAKAQAKPKAETPAN